MSTFKELGISDKYIRALSEININTPSEIQKKAIPFLLNNSSDFIGQAQTGTGKTAAFGLPLLEKMDSNDSNVQALILAPTRELCQQIAKQLFKFTKYSERIFVEAVYGGEKIDNQIRNLAKPTQIVVATPGRLIDLLEREAIDLSFVNTVVLDEADEMLSMGFKQELDKILRMTNQQSFTWLFSATLPDELKAMVEKYLSEDAHKIQIDKKDVVNKLIEHQYFVSSQQQKLEYVFQFLKTQSKMNGIIFCRTKAAVQNLTKQLIARNIAADALHGDLEQRDRDKVMRAFKNHKLQILVATDISARGIDVDNLAYVIHYQLPDQLEYYTHRSGRTARAGKRGISICFVSPDEVKKLKVMERVLNINFIKIK
ncbi:MAG: DEAD/DEAH box helicase [Crocinitomicaceae bacterium]|nr:MAG: DEAD/DEAH box helicase [Crocinitomicaceae bacterium]